MKLIKSSASPATIEKKTEININFKKCYKFGLRKDTYHGTFLQANLKSAPFVWHKNKLWRHYFLSVRSYPIFSSIYEKGCYKNATCSLLVIPLIIFCHGIKIHTWIIAPDRRCRTYMCSPRLPMKAAFNSVGTSTLTFIKKKTKFTHCKLCYIIVLSMKSKYFQGSKHAAYHYVYLF